MVSIRMDRCKTPRPNTKNLSAESVGSTRMAKFFSNSRSKRSLMWREVTYFPSFPKKGESLMVNNILMVGSSMAMVGRGSGCSGSVTESPISKSSKPTIAQRSPAWTSDTFFRPKPSKTCNSLIRDFCWAPSRLTKQMGSLVFSRPRCKRPMAIRPVKEE